MKMIEAHKYFTFSVGQKKIPVISSRADYIKMISRYGEHARTLFFHASELHKLVGIRCDFAIYIPAIQLGLDIQLQKMVKYIRDLDNGKS